MKIKFKFNSRSSGQGVPAAVELAKKCGGFIDNNFYVIEFSDPKDKNLGRLFSLVGGLKGSVILVNEGEPVNAGKFFYAVNCQERLLCKGVCKHLKLGYYDVDQFAHNFALNIEGDVLKTSNPSLFRLLSNFLEPISETQFKFKKSLFLEHAEIELATERQFCDKFDLEKFAEYVNNLPSEIELLSQEELEPYKERYEEDQDIMHFLSDCAIDNKLPFETIVRCAKAISLLSFDTEPIRVLDSDILVYSFPETNHIILVKLIVKEIESNEEELNNEEETYVITKKQGFFLVENEEFDVYFQMYDESDPAVEEHFKNLKKL